MTWTVEVPDDVRRVEGYSDDLDEWFAERPTEAPVEREGDDSE